MNEIITSNYAEFKRELDTEIKREAEGFVKIGYLLRLARETDILKESEYANVNDFARKEYGLDASQVSRFISINERFSEGGYSERLEEKYEGFGVAKLSIMLQLPESINENLTPDYTKSEINALREEVKEEAKTTDIEIMMEPKTDNPFTAAVKEMLKAEPATVALLKEVKARLHMHKDYKEALAPYGAFKSVRLDGIGRVILKFDDSDIVKLIKVRENATEEHELNELADAIEDYLTNDYKETAPAAVVEEPKKSTVTDLSKIALVQPKSKVTKAEPKKEKTIKKVEEHEAEIIPPENHFDRENITAETPSAMPEPEEPIRDLTEETQEPEQAADVMQDIISQLEPCEEVQQKLEVIHDYFEQDIQDIKMMIKMNPTIDYLESAVARSLKLADMIRELIYIKKKYE